MPPITDEVALYSPIGYASVWPMPDGVEFNILRGQSSQGPSDIIYYLGSSLGNRNEGVWFYIVDNNADIKCATESFESEYRNAHDVATAVVSESHSVGRYADSEYHGQELAEHQYVDDGHVWTELQPGQTEQDLKDNGTYTGYTALSPEEYPPGSTVNLNDIFGIP